MIGDNYKAHRDNVLDLFEGYKSKRENFDENDGVDIIHLSKRIDSLKNKKFTIAVAGEVKSGKSTFINALLGKEVLPSDVLQATSSIVEIFKSKTTTLEVVYGDETNEEVNSDTSENYEEEANGKLREICSVNDEFRVIPHTLINEYILEHENEIDIQDLLIYLQEKKVSGLNDKKEIIEKYLKQNPKSKIPVEINFGYPFKWEFDGLRIVDTPGVNATGGIQDVALDYFEKANAILFVHPVKPIESESFRKFVTEVISKRSKENLFLILTHSGLYDSVEVERLLAEAKRLYGNDISEDKIIAVDSLLCIVHNQLKNGVSLIDVRKELKKKKAIADYKDQAEEEGIDLANLLWEESGFDHMYASLDDYITKVPEIQLKEILDKIKNGYVRQQKLTDEEIERLNLKKSNPQIFEQEIERISQALKKYQISIYRIKEDIECNYKSINAKSITELDKIEKDFSDKINQCDSMIFLRKLALDAENSFKDFVRKFTLGLTNDLNNKMNNAEIIYKKDHNISVPRIDLEAIIEKSKEKAYEFKDIYEDRDVDFWDTITLGAARLFRDNKVKIGTEKLVNNENHFQISKEGLIKHINENKRKLKSSSDKIIEDYLSEFISKTNGVIKNRQDALNKEVGKKETNDEIIKKIGNLNERNKLIPYDLQRVEEILVDIQ
jgi:hypothetical protein